MNVVQQLKSKIDHAGLWKRTLVVERNEVLKNQGACDTQFYYIVSGTIRVFFEDEMEEQVLRLGYPGEFIGALDAFLSVRPSELNIQALKKCELKVIEKKAFDLLIRSNMENLLLWAKILENIVVQQLEREVDLLTSSPQKRYQKVLSRSPQLFQEIPAKYIASYLRMSPETLSRLKKS